MLSFYRKHVIVVLRDNVLSAEISELASGTPLPTKVTAAGDAAEENVVEAARALIDLYLEAQESGLTGG